MFQFPLRRAHLFNAVIAIVVVLMSVIMTNAFMQWRDYKNASDVIQETQDVMLHMEKLWSLGMDQIHASYEPISNNSNKDSLSTLGGELSVLSELLRKQPNQLQLIDSLNNQFREIKLLRTRANDSSFGSSDQSLVQQLELQWRKFITLLQGNERRFLASKKQAYEVKAQRFQNLLIYRGAVIFLFFALLGIKMTQNSRKKKQSERDLAALNAELEYRVILRTQELKESQQVLKDTLVRIHEGFVSFDENWRYQMVNLAFCELCHKKPEELYGKGVWEDASFVPGADTKALMLKTKLERSFQKNESYDADKDSWFENSIYPSGNGITMYIRNITAQKKAEERLSKSNRLLALISQINQMIVRVTDLSVLLKEACNIAVRQGRFSLAWIGVTDPERRQMQVAASAGTANAYLFEMDGKLDESATHAEPAIQAFKQEKVIVCNELLESDNGDGGWRKMALEAGLGSIAVVPIVQFGKVVAVFAFYASTKNGFDEGEISLLESAAADVGFAMEHLEKAAAHKAALAEVNASNERFELVSNATRDVVWDMNLLTGELWWNNHYYEIFGYAPIPAHLRLQHWKSKIHVNDQEKVITSFDLAIADGQKSWNAEYRYLASDNSIMYILDRAFIQYREDGKAVRMIGIKTNVTQLKKAEYAIVNERNLSNGIINSLPGLFYLCSKEGEMIRWNNNFEKVSQMPHEKIRTTSPARFFRESDRPMIEATIRKVFETGEAALEADFLLPNDDTVPYYLTGKRIQYEGKECLLGLGIDFSDRKKAQEEIRETTEKLHALTAHLQMVREEERNRIGRAIHDELGQQMTAIKMDVSWIDKKITTPSDGVRYKLKNILQLLDGSNQAVAKILSELRPGIDDGFSLAERIDWLGRQFTENKGIAVELVVNGASHKLPPTISTCVYRIYQEALDNIGRHANAQKVLTLLTVKDQSLFFVVDDDGDGFDLSLLKTTKTFGLFSIKERILSLKGTFEVISETGKGTTLTAIIPINEP